MQKVILLGFFLITAAINQVFADEIMVNPAVFTQSPYISKPDKAGDPVFVATGVDSAMLAAVTHLAKEHPLNNPYVFASVASGLLNAPVQTNDVIKKTLLAVILDRYPDIETKRSIKSVQIVSEGVLLISPGNDPIVTIADCESGEFQFYMKTSVLPIKSYTAIYVLAIIAVILSFGIGCLLLFRRKKQIL